MAQVHVRQPQGTWILAFARLISEGRNEPELVGCGRRGGLIDQRALSLKILRRILMRNYV